MDIEVHGAGQKGRNHHKATQVSNITNIASSDWCTTPSGRVLTGRSAWAVQPYEPGASTTKRGIYEGGASQAFCTEAWAGVDRGLIRGLGGGRLRWGQWQEDRRTDDNRASDHQHLRSHERHDGQHDG